MTSDQLDEYAKRLAFQSIEVTGDPADAAGVLVQAAVIISMDQYGVEATILSLERLVAGLRADVASGRIAVSTAGGATRQ